MKFLSRSDACIPIWYASENSSVKTPERFLHRFSSKAKANKWLLTIPAAQYNSCRIRIGLVKKIDSTGFSFKEYSGDGMTQVLFSDTPSTYAVAVGFVTFITSVIATNFFREFGRDATTLGVIGVSLAVALGAALTARACLENYEMTNGDF
jgi:hypothetical protein